MSNVILIGFMGIGKGTLARFASKKSKMYAIDTDDLIESLENKKIKDIFTLNGELYFRKLEQQTANWLENNVSNSIISTGGGFFKVKNIKKIGKIVLMDSSFDGILSRILSMPNAKKKLKKRPLFQDIKKAKKLYIQRVKEYKKIADYIIDVENRDLEDIYKDLEKIIKK